MNKNEKTEKQEMTEEEIKEKITAYKNVLKEIKLKGTFKALYYKVRKGTVQIAKTDKDDTEKKSLLIQLCNEIIAEAQETQD